MTYNEAKSEVLKTKWKTEVCSAGENCWCRLIVPETPLLFKEGLPKGEGEIEHIIHSGGIDKFYAEYIVELHNKSL